MDLAASLPKVANWQQSTLPKFLEPEQVERLINACNRATPAGRRDYIAVCNIVQRAFTRAGLNPKCRGSQPLRPFHVPPLQPR